MAVRLCLPRHARPLSMLLVKRWCAKQDSNLHCTPSEGAASCHLGYWRIRGEQNKWRPHPVDRIDRCGRNGVRAEPCRRETSTGRPDNTNGAGCVSRTRMFRVTRAALYLVQPSRQKTKMVSGAPPLREATLQQGLPLQAECGAAGQFWTFTMSNSETQYFHARRSDALRRRTRSCSHVVSAAALRTRRYIQPDGVPARVGEAEPTHAQARTGRNRCRCLSLWTIRSLLPVRRRAGPPPV